MITAPGGQLSAVSSQLSAKPGPLFWLRAES
jgi:hypothetical protein